MTITALVAAWLGGGCGDPGRPPFLAEVGPQVAVVGEELVIVLVGSDPDGDPLEYSFSSYSLPTLRDGAVLQPTPDGRALFTWTPLADDLGEHVIEFVVSDGEYQRRMPTAVEVRGAAGEGSQPVFVEPLGEGLVHDLADGPCVPEVSITVQDPDDTTLELRQEAPVIEGSALAVTPDGLGGTWTWCPSAEQRATAGIHELVLAADDGDNPPTIKRFSVWLKRAGEDCPTVPPTLQHAPFDVETLADPELIVTAGDDVGLPFPPIVFWSTESVPITQMTSVSMMLVDGNATNGTYRVTLPNPAVPLGAGSTASLHYLIAVGDDDGCFAQSPGDDTLHEKRVTNPGGPGAGPCQPCSYDAQCGGQDDLCLQFGAEQAACGKACSSDGECAVGLVCSAAAVISVEGQGGRQCVPQTGGCNVVSCEDDDSEPNDDLAQALDNPPLPEGALSGRRLCPLDEDWYHLVLPQRARVLALLSGSPTPDMALMLTTEGGVPVTLEASPGTSVEELDSPCVDPGDYALRVFSPFDGAGEYQLSYVLDVAAC
ncbi:Ig-like domain-containing protein [Paraliomyxa miuraensis]|uniref:Ig-like domain-containing protein n=1 Tax=Paraliomyxa miuraensis TaxID=376150 RepID=UPI002255F023|nr:Ig-like domain-containing protein [Paraliomyxa miuraensis]MCX4242041.1 hypothetical protein [Paraliomyxa miuraensis]